MHKSQNYLLSSLYKGKPTKEYVTSQILSASQAGALEVLLREDAIDYLYSATVSLGDALGGISRELFTWATVKLYYSTFYAMRARLAVRGVGLFYVKAKPFSIFARPGQSARTEKGQTHKVVLDLFRRHNLDPFMLSQPIGTDDPLQWLMNLREEVNYKMARFTEPDVPQHFAKLCNLSLRQACSCYLEDATAMYVFDPDHAIVAFPLSLIERSCREFQRHGLSIRKKEDTAFFNKLISDKKGPLAHVLNIF
jgi:hypothetical protein